MATERRYYAPHLGTAGVVAKQRIEASAVLCFPVPKAGIPYACTHGEQATLPRANLLSAYLFVLDAVVKTIRATTTPGAAVRSRILFEQIVNTASFIDCVSQKRYPDASKDSVQTVIWALLDQETAHQLQATIEAKFTELESEDKRRRGSNRRGAIPKTVSMENIRTADHLWHALSVTREGGHMFEYALSNTIPDLMATPGHLFWYLAPPDSFGADVAPLQSNERLVFGGPGGDDSELTWKSPYPETAPYFLYDFGPRPFCLSPTADTFATTYFLGTRPDPERYRQAVDESIVLLKQNIECSLDDLIDYDTEDLVRGASDEPGPVQVADPAYRRAIYDEGVEHGCCTGIEAEFSTAYKVAETRKYPVFARAIADAVQTRASATDCGMMHGFFEAMVPVVGKLTETPGVAVPPLYAQLRRSQGRLTALLNSMPPSRSKRIRSAFHGLLPYEIASRLDALWKRYLNLGQAQASIASFVFNACCIPILGDLHLVHVQLNGLHATGKSHAVRTVLDMLPEEAVVQQDYASALAATLSKDERGVLSMDETEQGAAMDPRKVKVLKSLTETGTFSSERTVQDPSTGLYGTQKVQVLAALRRIETGNYAMDDKAMRSRYMEVSMPSITPSTTELNPDRVKLATLTIQYMYMAATVGPFALNASGLFPITTTVDQVFRAFLAKRDPLFPVPGIRDWKKITTMAVSEMMLRLYSSFGSTKDPLLRSKQYAVNSFVTACDLAQAFSRFSYATNERYRRTILMALRILVDVTLTKVDDYIGATANVQGGYYRLRASAGLFSEVRGGQKYGRFTQSVSAAVGQVAPHGRPSDALIDRTLAELQNDSDHLGRPVLTKLTDENGKLSMGLRVSDDCIVLTQAEQIQLKFLRRVQAGMSTDQKAHNSFDEEYYVLSAGLLDQMAEPDGDPEIFSHPVLKAELARLRAEQTRCPAFRGGATKEQLVSSIALLRAAGILGIKNVTAADYSQHPIEDDSACVPSILRKGLYKRPGLEMVGRLCVKISHTEPRDDDADDMTASILRDFVSIASPDYQNELVPFAGPLQASLTDIPSITIPAHCSFTTYPVPDSQYRAPDLHDTFLEGSDDEDDGEAKTPQFFTGEAPTKDLMHFEDEIRMVHLRRLFRGAPDSELLAFADSIGSAYPRTCPVPATKKRSSTSSTPPPKSRLRTDSGLG